MGIEPTSEAWERLYRYRAMYAQKHTASANKIKFPHCEVKFIMPQD